MGYPGYVAGESSSECNESCGGFADTHPPRVYRLFDFSSVPAADALRIVRRLQAAGFVAYLAGGCVRDGLLGLTPKDFDVATDATPEAVRELFGQRRTLAFGASFGVIGVQGEGPAPTEVATFRCDGTYSDGRRPDHVRYGNAEGDALRRDYTINGLFYDPVADVVVDFVGGRADLAGRIVRAIGDPSLRIGEDKLRMLRAIRFAAVLGFKIDGATVAAIRQFATQVTVTSGERIGAEMRRMLGSHGAPTAIELLSETHLLPVIWPGLEERPGALALAIRLAGAVQPPNFAACVAAICGATAENPRQMIGQLAAAWRWSTEELESVDEAIRNRDLVVQADRLPWSVVQPVLVQRYRDTTLAAAEAWAIGTGGSRAGLDRCHQRIANWPPERLDPPHWVTGQTLIELGHRPGPDFKRALAAVRAAQLDGQISTVAEGIAIAESLLGARPNG